MDNGELRQYLETTIAEAEAEFDAANKQNDICGIARVYGRLSGAMKVAAMELGWMERRTKNEKGKTNG